MPSLSRVQPCGSRFERFLDTCLSAATRLWAIPCRFSPPLSAPSDSPATWPLFRRAPVGRHGSPDKVLAKTLRWGSRPIRNRSNCTRTESFAPMYGSSDFRTSNCCSCSPATWPLLRRAPEGCHGSPDRVFARNPAGGGSRSICYRSN